MAPPPQREADVLRRAAEVLQELLPDGWESAVTYDVVTATGERVDAVVTLTAPDGGGTTLVLGCRRTLVTRDLPYLRDRLTTLGAALPARSVPVVVARYLSASVRQWLDENALSYMDATGNIRISSSQPALYVRDRGSDRDPWRGPGRPRGTLRGEPAARVVRALADFAPPTTVPELLDRSGASTGATYRALEFLLQEGLIEREARGPIASIAWRRILERWSQDYGFQSSHDVVRALQPRGVPALLADLAGIAGSEARYAITGSLAAARWEPYAPARVAMIYADDPARMLTDLSLRPVESGANVLLAVPRYDVVFDCSTSSEGITYVSASQAAVDLLTGPGRNPSEGQALLDWMEADEPAWRQ